MRKKTDFTNKLWYSGLFNLVILVCEIIGFIIAIKTGSGQFRYFTVLSNVFLMVTTAGIMLWQVFGNLFTLPKWLMVLRYMSVCMVALTFLIVMLVLVPKAAINEGGAEGAAKLLVKGNMLFYHIICPVLAIISFCVFERDHQMKIGEVGLAMLPTIVYGIVMIILNALAITDGPYVFLRVRFMPVKITIMWIVLVFAIDLVVAVILRGRKKKKNA